MKKLFLSHLFLSYCSILAYCGPIYAMARDSSSLQAAEDDLSRDFNRILTISNTRTIDYSKQNITDDEIATTIRPIPPLSVSNFVHILAENEPLSIVKINLAHNLIYIDGAAQLLKYIAAHVKHLQELNLAHNDIKGKRLAFTDALIAVLKMPSLKALDLTGSISAYKYGKLKAKMDERFYRKIVWQK